ncbi:MAG: GAF domain-containing protein [Erysipelotrichaceae bacterium]|nr:GAF domain-containing protein [Erysipelotrichaceae bacterium]
MFKEELYPKDKHDAYQLLLKQAKALLSDENDIIANLANISALLKVFFGDNVNWVGFYRLDDSGELILGPFQGKVACTRLPKGKGVCQKAVATKQTVIIEDVHLFADHIACDSASNSEIVVPLIKGGHVLWVLDVDSIIINNFDQLDLYYLEQIVEIIKESI